MRKLNGGTVAVIIINIMLITMIAFSIGSARFGAVIGKYGSDWPVVDVTIDDVSFEYDDSDEDDGDVTYYYKLKRILHFTYEGKDYEINDTEEIRSGSPNYQYELKTGYKDQYTYKINPENPRSYSKSYSSLGDGTEIRKVLNFIAIGVPVIILVIVDSIAISKMFRRKKNVFDME